MPAMWLLLSFVHYSLALGISVPPNLEIAEKREGSGSGM